MPAVELPPRSSIFNHSFYVKIVCTFIGLLLITVVPILYYNFYESRKIVLDLCDEQLNQTSRTVIEKMNNYFLPASITVDMSSTLSEIGAIPYTNHAQVERYTLGVLKYYPQVAMFYLADEHGCYIRAWKLPDGTMEGRLIRQDTSPPSDIFKYWDSEFRLLRTEKSDKQIDYDPRVRPWYTGAKDTSTNYWTDSYILFRNKKPAITASHPVVGRDGEIAGVWAMDIELDEISSFLKGLKIGRSGIAFILNQKNELVAYPEFHRIIKEENGTISPVHVQDLGVEAVSAAFREHEKTGKKKFTITSGRKRYLVSFTEFPKTFPVPWKMGILVPEDDFIMGARALMIQALVISSFILAGAILAAFFIARSITRPIQLLAEETKKIKNFHLEERIAISSYIKEIQMMSNAISAMKSGLKAFRRYVPAELVRQLIHTGKEARLGGQKKELTVFFSDVSGFTTIAESMSPEELMVNLSEYFDELTKILSRRHGTVDKYIGDAILAFWGAPLHDEEHVFNACSAGLDCQEKIAELNQRWESEGRHPFITRIGISTGETVVGNVGSSERINYTVMGDNVNLASRLEGTNKLFGTRIIVSHRTCEVVADKFWFRLLGTVAVKGKKEETTIYELMGRKAEGESEGETAWLCSEFTRGVEAYQAKEWTEACRIFKSIQERFPSDAPSKFYLSRCSHYIENPPESNWQGIEKLHSK
ncbi:MAG: adenylate/guanylate cyclase domain-containing protein [Syntrophobacteraceae bacterium]